MATDADARTVADEVTSIADQQLFTTLAWLTPRTVLYATLGWVGVFAVGSIALANPFMTERAAGAGINYWNTMYLHGLLIGMVGIALLLGMMSFRIRWRHAWLLVCGGVIVATLLDTVGGIFDRHESPTSAGMWTQVVGFFALDEMLAVVVLACMVDWFARAEGSRRLSFLVAWLSAISMLIAAVMGHIAGWVLDYGPHPWFVVSYARFVGEKVTDLQANLTSSHSHEMAVALSSFVIAAGVAFFAERRRGAPGAVVRRLGLAAVAVGVVVFTTAYVAAGFTTWAIPAWFQSANGTNGVAADDLVTGLAMVGGLVALVGSLLARVARPVWPLVAAAWTWLLSIGLVVATGYWIELHETHFGAGDPTAPGAPADAVFTWFHQDIGLFLLPLVTAVMLATAHLVDPDRQAAIAVTAIAGSSVLFAGGMVYVFGDPAVHGAGYVISTIGLLVVGAAMLASSWWGLAARMLQARQRTETPQSVGVVR
jgi:hypothetical protein